MDRVDCESIGFICPALTDKLVWRQPLQCLQSAGVIVGINEVIELLLQLIMIVVMIPFDRSFLDRAVHTFDLSICP